MQSVTIGGNQAGQRLDKFLHKYLPNAGNGFLYKMLRKKNITLNGRKAEGSEILSLDDTVAFFFSEETFAKFSGLGQAAQTEGLKTVRAEGLKTVQAEGQKTVRAEKTNTAQTKSPSTEQGKKACPKTRDIITNNTPGAEAAQGTEARLAEEGRKAYRLLKGITVLYEDDNILILNKPQGILTQKAQREDSSLNEWLTGYLLEREPSFQKELHTFRPSVCNRLDRNTSGIVLCGKSLAGSQYLSRCIRERSVRKFYRTICAGCIKEPQAIHGYLEKDSAKNRVTVWDGQDKASPEAAPIHTAFVPLAWSNAISCKGAVRNQEEEQRKTEDKHGYTLLEVELITGKPHQIRAQLAGIGHPLIGDFKYGDAGINRQFREEFGLSCQLLHASRVEFPAEEDNAVGKALSGRKICAPCPVLFARLQDALDLPAGINIPDEKSGSRK